MATIEKQFLSKTGLTLYDQKIKAYADASAATAETNSKAYADSLASNYDAAGTAATKVNELANGAVADNTAAIATLNGDATTTGSVAKAVADAKTELEGKITASIYDDTQVKADIATNASNITALDTRVTTVEGKVTTLIGDDADKSVRTIAVEELAKQLIPETAQESLDTLTEIADWIQNHPDEAAKLNSDIIALQNLVGTIPEGASATTIIAYISEAVGTETTRATGAEGSLDSRLTEVEAQLGIGEDEGGSVAEAIETAKQEAITTAAGDATTKANQALTNAKSYADGLATNYATAEQGAKADTAVQSVTTGVTNGTIAVDGTDVAVKGLGSAAYTASTAYDAAGTAETKVNELALGDVTTNKNNIATLTAKVESLESVTYTEITSEEIEAMFSA